MRSLVVILILFSIFLNVSSKKSTQTKCVLVPWQQNVTRSLFTYDQVQACLDVTPLDPLVKKSTLDTVSKAMESYAFRDSIKSSPPSQLLPIKVDIQSEFEKISATKYPSDYAFQQDLANLFIKLKDPHTLYSKPSSCYNFSFIQPFIFTSQMEGNVQVISIQALSPYANVWASQFPSMPSLDKYIGKTVSAINGIPAIKHVLSFVIEEGYISKDVGSLFNFALFRKQLGVRNQIYNGLPKGGPIMSYSFADGTAPIEVPWLAINLMTKPLPLDSSCMVRPPTPPQQSPKNKMNKNAHRELLEMVRPTEDDPTPIVPIYNTGSVRVSLLNKDVMIMRILDFVPENETLFLESVFNSVALASTFYMPYLILDLRGNGGGDICLGYQVIDALMEETNPYGHYDIIHSKASDVLMTALALPKNKNLDFAPQFWIDPDTRQPYTNISWYTPGIQRTRAGVTSTYSNIVHLACDDVTAPVHYLFKKILILTDGLCGSTCAVFSSHLNQADHVDTVVVGGLHNISQQFFSFPGGEVVSIGEISELVKLANVSDPSIPPPFNTTANVRFTFQEIYGWIEEDDPNIPLEFLFKPATFKLEQWSFDSDMGLYTEVEKYFKMKSKEKMKIN